MTSGTPALEGIVQGLALPALPFALEGTPVLLGTQAASDISEVIPSLATMGPFSALAFLSAHKSHEFVKLMLLILINHGRAYRTTI